MEEDLLGRWERWWGEREGLQPESHQDVQGEVVGGIVVEVCWRLWGLGEEGELREEMFGRLGDVGGYLEGWKGDCPVMSGARWRVPQSWITVGGRVLGGLEQGKWPSLKL